MRNQYRIQTVGETYDIAFILFYVSVAAQNDVHPNQAHHTFRQLGQAATLGKTKVVEVEVVARDDDGDGTAVFIEVPFVQVDVYIFVGYRLEEHFGRQVDACFLHTQPG